MNSLLRAQSAANVDRLRSATITNMSRRSFLGAVAGALVVGLVVDEAKAAVPTSETIMPGTRIAAFIEIKPDGTVRLLSPFVEGGQGINTALAQIVGEELDLDPAKFTVECAPPGADYALVNGLRMTGGSFSTRSSYAVMRRLGAAARDMLIRAGATRLGVPTEQLTSDNGRIVHAASGRSLAYSQIASDAMALTPASDPKLRDEASFRYIRKPVKRLDVRDKSTGKAVYAIDQKLDGMLYAAVRHAPHLGTAPLALKNEDEIAKLRGVHSIHSLSGSVAVTADSWHRARRAVEALDVAWSDPKPTGLETVAADFSSHVMLDALKGAAAAGVISEQAGDADAAFKRAGKTVEADYDAPYLAHGQLEPPSAMARFNADGTLEVWTPNQMPELFQSIAAETGGVAPERVILHSPILGGFFGRHFFYGSNPFTEAIALAKATGKPVKVLWSREEEFLMDALRPLSFSRFKAALDAAGRPLAIKVRTVGEGPIGRWFGSVFKEPVDSSAVEGIVKKPYDIPHRAMEYLKLPHPVTIAFWRSVGHSMNDYFYESFLDEMAEAGKRDPFELRRELLAGQPRFLTLLDTVAAMSGGWKRGPFVADGGKRARGIAMASPFGSETATIAEVSVKAGRVRVHNLWIAFDPGSIVNPAIVKSQVESAAALGLSATLFEELSYKNGLREASNFDSYSILRREHMPRVHVTILESGAPMGGVGEPGLPGVAPAVANAVAALTGQRVRSLPFAKSKLGAS